MGYYKTTDEYTQKTESSIMGVSDFPYVHESANTYKGFVVWEQNTNKIPACLTHIVMLYYIGAVWAELLIRTGKVTLW